ncbi:MAG TPA: ABC transporter ATP-binding protein [Longimicrobiales bacterium]|nr:ABC transporter ATP-binding protein [Longimicrobiales bacterium]
MSVRGEARLYWRVLRYLGGYEGLLALAILATMGFAFFDAFSLVMLIPFLNALFGDAPLSVGSSGSVMEWLLTQTVGRVMSPGMSAQDLLLGIILFMLAIFALKNVFDFLKRYLVARLEQSVTRDLRNEVYGHLLDLDLRFFGRTRAGQVVSRLTGDAELLRSLVTRNVAQALTAFLRVIAALALLLSISVELTLVSVVVLPGIFLVWSRVVRRLRRGDRRVLNLAGEVSSHIQETVSGIRLVKAAAAENAERKRFGGLTQDYFRTFLRTETLRAATGPLSEMLAALGTLLLLWYGSHLVLVEGTLTGAAFIGFLGVSMQLYSPAKELSRLPATIQPGLAAAERVFEFLDAPIEITDRAGARPFTGLSEGIRFEGVEFHYVEGEPVLRDVDLRVAVGEVVALVGPSGSGKTTLVDLVARFYDPTGGRITFDGVDLREYSIASLRSNLGIVTQETVLFHDTVRANIAYGLEDVADADMERAARAAHAHEFIGALPEGYDTVLGERGTRLSGGQRQRIAIARAILRDPPILIFDEATSALDSASERHVQEAVAELLHGRTVFVIAHRLSTIKHADQILVLREGRIVDTGRHDELIARDGTYRYLYELQTSGA